MTTTKNINQIASLLLLLIMFNCIALVSAPASSETFTTDDPLKSVYSVPLSRIEERINIDKHADGIQLAISVSQKTMRIDIKEIPADTSNLAILRVIMMIGRLAEPDYTEMRFSDEGTDIFVINGETIREIGSEFIWGETDKGQNPIHLVRLFVDALRTADGNRVAPPMTGSLIGDTMTALTTIKERFHPEWTMRTIEIR